MLPLWVTFVTLIEAELKVLEFQVPTSNGNATQDGLFTDNVFRRQNRGHGLQRGLLPEDVSQEDRHGSGQRPLSLRSHLPDLPGRFLVST